MNEKWCKDKEKETWRKFKTWLFIFHFSICMPNLFYSPIDMTKLQVLQAQHRRRRGEKVGKGFCRAISLSSTVERGKCVIRRIIDTFPRWTWLHVNVMLCYHACPFLLINLSRYLFEWEVNYVQEMEMFEKLNLKIIKLKVRILRNLNKNTFDEMHWKHFLKILNTQRMEMFDFFLKKINRQKF